MLFYLAIREERKTIMENLQVIERENQRVLTTAQIAEQYETSVDTEEQGTVHRGQALLLLN